MSFALTSLKNFWSQSSIKSLATEIIGVRRQRIFATSSEHCNRTGGVAIFVPQSYDDILSICHCEHDPSQIPRFLTILAKLQGHCKVFLSVVYGSPKSQGEKNQIWTRYHKHIESLISRFGDSPVILAGDTNEKLDGFFDSSGICTTSSTPFGKIMNSLGLADLYGAAERSHSRNDKIRMQRQDKIICEIKDFKTFFPKIVGCKASRIDSIFCSQALVNQMSSRNIFSTYEISGADHRSVHLSFEWTLPGILCTNDGKTKFFYRNSLLNCKKYTKKMKKCVRNTLISEYLKIGGTVPKNQIQKILTKDLQYLFINREKNGARFSYIDIWYQIYKKVE